MSHGTHELDNVLEDYSTNGCSGCRAIHRGGVGKSAVAAAERAAASPPVNATVVALNTLRKDIQESEVFLKKAFDDRGMTRPKKIRTNQDWYVGQGYEVIPGPETALYVDTTTKQVETVSIVWMKKELAQPQ